MGLLIPMAIAGAQAGMCDADWRSMLRHYKEE
jgi:hypothetical protein